MGSSDEDMNLVFRFDISEKENIKGEYNMEIFIVHQRKGRFVPFWIETVYEKDFELIKNYLEIRYKKIQNLWSPFSTLANNLNQ